MVGMYFCPCGITWIELEQSPMGIYYLSFACLTLVPTNQRQKLKMYLMITFPASTEDIQITQN